VGWPQLKIGLPSAQRRPRFNDGFAKGWISFVTDRHFQSALREWRAVFRGPTVYIILIAVAALLAILGPFGTGDRLSLVERVIYWLVMVAGTYSIGFVVNTWLRNRIPGAWSKPVRLGLVSVATGIAITPFVTVQNYVSFGYWPTAAEWPELLAQFLVIALIVTVIFQTITAQRPANEVPQSMTPAVLDRLPFEKRGALVALSSEDHYTLVRTTKGEELVLIRLADAIREAEPAKGLQVHRSHWVAVDQVLSGRRTAARAVLTLSTGREIPVSRSYIADVKEAGLILR